MAKRNVKKKAKKVAGAAKKHIAKLKGPLKQLKKLTAAEVEHVAGRMYDIMLEEQDRIMSKAQKELDKQLAKRGYKKPSRKKAASKKKTAKKSSRKKTTKRKVKR